MCALLLNVVEYTISCKRYKREKVELFKKTVKKSFNAYNNFEHFRHVVKNLLEVNDLIQLYNMLNSEEKKSNIQMCYKWLGK